MNGILPVRLHALLLAAGIVLAAVPRAVAAPEAQDVVGIYWDTGGESNFTATTEP